jgi:hypothetical protein
MAAPAHQLPLQTLRYKGIDILNAAVQPADLLIAQGGETSSPHMTTDKAVETSPRVSAVRWRRLSRE